MRAESRERETAPGGKEKLSRVSRRHRREARKKRRIILALVLAAVAVLAAGAAFDIPYINVVREAGSWLGERFSGSGEKEASEPSHPFLAHPQTGKELGAEAAVLLAVYGTQGDGTKRRTILYLALFTYDAAGGKGEVYLVPETSVAYNADGRMIELRQALEEEGGEDLLRSTVGNMAGADVDYLVLLDFWDAARLLQGLGLPPITLAEETVLVNPLNGETNYLVAGQEVRDADRLLFYLMASDRLEMWESFSARLERLREYLPRALGELEAEDVQRLEAVASSLSGDSWLDPGTGSRQGDGRYLASMLQASAELGEGLAFRAVPQVEVLNGCGVPDLGRRVGDRLASLGVPLAGTGGNAKVTVDGEEVNDFTHEVSSIVYRSRDQRVAAFARYLGVLLSVKDVRLEPGPGPELVLIAGKDMAV